MKVGIVIPWFGEDISGGAERHAGGLARALISHNIEAELLTTCGKDSFSDWDKDYYKEGLCEIEGIPIRRFSLRKRNKNLYDNNFGKLLQGQKLSYVEELQLHHETVNSDNLYEFIYQNHNEYIYFFMPYLFGTTYWGTKIIPRNSFLIPCLHDEEMAYLKTIQQTFINVYGIMFNTEEEKNLACSIYQLQKDKYIVAGEGVESESGNIQRFREKYRIKNDYIIYVGRQVKGKNVHTLLYCFTDYIKNTNRDIKLVMIGKPEDEIAELIKKTPNVVSLGVVDEQDKRDAIKGAIALCQPSLMESFSIVIMESWLQNTPVIVHKDCKVTKAHCDRSGGGFYFNDSGSFENIVNKLLDDRDMSERMGQEGNQYVLYNYSWNTIAEKILDFVRSKGFEI